MNAFSIPALTAVSIPFTTVLQKLWGTPELVEVNEATARHVRVGSYWDHKGRIWKVTKISRPDDWFDDQVTLHLSGPDQEKALHWPIRVRWLEDE